jgi:stress response protein SCP2
VGKSFIIATCFYVKTLIKKLHLPISEKMYLFFYMLKYSKNRSDFVLELMKGQRINISKQYPHTKQLRLDVSWALHPQYQLHTYDIDVSIFMLNEKKKIPAEEYFVFYNNPRTSDGSLQLHLNQTTGVHQVFLNLSSLPNDIREIIVVLTIHDAQSKKQNFSHFSKISLNIVDIEKNERLFSYSEIEFSTETACELGNIYTKDGDWRFNPVGQGYQAGLQQFLDRYHDENTSSEPKPIPDLQTLEPIKLSSFDLLKKKVDIVLEKKALQKTAARVGVVLDISGSMRRLYKDGIVQNVMERLLALATRFDNDGVLDVWIYDDEFSRMPAVTEKELPNYIEREILNNPDVSKFGQNNEPPVMRDVLRKYLKEETSTLPVYLIFINDGGIKKSSQKRDSVPKVLIDSSDKPLFWQFVGIGDGNFHVLRTLDELSGRYIDNANFFQIPFIEKESDEELYEKLLNEFPIWLKEARSKGMI